MLTFVPPGWTADAFCRDLDVRLFFPDRHNAATVVPWAKQVCARCSVQPACLAYAVDVLDLDEDGAGSRTTPNRYGLLGGLTARERTKYARTGVMPALPVPDGPLPPPPALDGASRAGEGCSVDGCDRGSYSKGLCRRHYDRRRRDHQAA